MATTIYGYAASAYWKTYIKVNNPVVNTNSVSVTVTEFGIYFTKTHTHNLSKDRPCNLYPDEGEADYYFYPTGSIKRDKGTHYKLNSSSKTFTFPRDSLSSRTCRIYAQIVQSGDSHNGNSELTYSFTVPKNTRTITYNKNTTHTVTNMPSSATVAYGDDYDITATVPRDTTDKDLALMGWNTKANGSGTSYTYGESILNVTSNITLYAQWTKAPSCSFNYLSKDKTKEGDCIKGFTTVSCTVNSTTPRSSSAPIASVVFKIGSATATKTSGFNNPFTLNVTTNTAGTFTPTVTVTDTTGVKRIYSLSSINVVEPKWGHWFVIDKSVAGAPPMTRGGYFVFESVRVYNYSTSPRKYDTRSSKYLKGREDDTTWSIYVEFDADHVHYVNSKYWGTVKLTYKHYDIEIKSDRKAFYSTSRNQNYSNGVYNVMFLSGVDNETNPAYSSRAWWSYYNDPTYFPDTNYLEVGSNDTSIQGLTKVGDYLAAIKQSKTIDTAIYLIYPTSFDSMATYAVKQGVQGVGAISRYAFNILGDETLFLSPRGVMAIVPTEDDDHKVQNRSYFIDGRLLKEAELSNAYSFVYDGKYYLSMGTGAVYVLDGNQRNSWGNDRTVLVYEGYYLVNVPAKCFVKYNDQLVFSDGTNICAFNSGYTDAYNDEGEEFVPVNAEWSTILDDDGSIHYYKTMQKKGNVVSILPTDYKFIQVEIDEATFNKKKTMYYIIVDGDYTRCKDDSEYDPDEAYFIKGASDTKVFIRKDNNDLIEIERKFSESSLIPSEMMLKKKCKKYKRLQFVVRNNEPEPFGVDEIVKSYTLGNYAKK